MKTNREEFEIKQLVTWLKETTGFGPENFNDLQKAAAVIERLNSTINHVLFNLEIIQKGVGCKVECKQRISMLIEACKDEH